MTMKTLLLGAAAGLVTVGAAQAADLPMMKAEPVEYVKVCSEFGAGFFYIPGSDTCIRLGGQIRVNYFYGDPDTRATDIFNFGGRGTVVVETNTNSEIGPIHTFVQINANFGNGDTSGSAAAVTDHAYVQFAGVTAGYTDTFYKFLDKYHNDTVFSDFYGNDNTKPLLAYTQTFGGGLSATVSVEDARGYRGDNVVNAPGGPFVNAIGGATVRGGQSVPDIVGNINYEGLSADKTSGFIAQVMGALHQSRSVFDTDAEYGFAVGAGVSVQIPVLAGAYIAAEGNYAQGANEYLGNPGAGRLGVSPEVALGLDGDLHRTEGYSIAGDAGIFVTPALLVDVFGSYAHLDTPDAAGTGDIDGYWVGGDVKYQLVKGLTISTEVGYNREEADDLADQDRFFGGLRIERNF